MYHSNLITDLHITKITCVCTAVDSDLKMTGPENKLKVRSKNDRTCEQGQKSIIAAWIEVIMNKPAKLTQPLEQT